MFQVWLQSVVRGRELFGHISVTWCSSFGALSSELWLLLLLPLLMLLEMSSLLGGGDGDVGCLFVVDGSFY